MIIYFSGTGNSAWVAQLLGEELHDRVCALSDLDPTRMQQWSLSPDEPVGFVFPVYAWAPPRVVRNFVRLLPTTAPSYVYFVCTCGDDTGQTAQVFADDLKAQGWPCQTGFSVFMPNTYVCLPGFDVDDEDTVRFKLENVPPRIRFIAEEVRLRVATRGMHCFEGTSPWLKTCVLGNAFEHFLMSPHPFHSTESCVGCGTCASVCPLQNIRLVEGRPVWGEECVHCLACYHACPAHAVEYGKHTLHKGQFRLKDALKKLFPEGVE